MKFYTLDDLRNQPSVPFLSTGLLFDEFIIGGGFTREGIHVIAGSTNVGKSTALMNIALALAERGEKVAYISLEDSLHSSLRKYNRFSYILDKNNEGNFNFMDRDLFRDQKTEIWDVIRDVTANDGITAIVVDGLETTLDGNEELHQSGNILMDNLARASVECSIPVFMGWQTARGTDSKDPKDIGHDDIATSMGVSRYAVSEFIMFNNSLDNDSTCIKCCKVRDFDFDRKLVKAVRNSNMPDYNFIRGASIDLDYLREKAKEAKKGRKTE